MIDFYFSIMSFAKLIFCFVFMLRRKFDYRYVDELFVKIFHKFDNKLFFFVFYDKQINVDVICCWNKIRHYIIDIHEQTFLLSKKTRNWYLTFSNRFQLNQKKFTNRNKKLIRLKRQCWCFCFEKYFSIDWYITSMNSSNCLRYNHFYRRFIQHNTLTIFVD